MVSNLRIFKSDKCSQKLADGGRGRLTKVIINKIQDYYGATIQQNIGSIGGMQDTIWAIFYHTIKGRDESLAHQH